MRKLADGAIDSLQFRVTPRYFILTFDLWMCFSFSLRRVYVINKEVCVRTVCAHEELLRGRFTALLVVSVCVDLQRCRVTFSLFSADMCRDQFSRCGVAALSGGCSSLGGSCGKSCGGCWWSMYIRDATCPDTAPFSTSLLHPPMFSSQVLLNFSCTTHYSCAKSTSVFFCLSFFFNTCLWINILQTTLMIVWITGAIKIITLVL